MNNVLSTPAVNGILNSLFMAETVFLKKLKPIKGKPGHYQIMRAKASRNSLWWLNKTLDRLSMAGIMQPSESASYKLKICCNLVEEFAQECPPEENMEYQFAGFDDYLTVKAI